MNYETFIAFVKNDIGFLENYYQDKPITFLDYMLSLQHEFKNWSVHNKSRKNFTSSIIERYFSQDLNKEEKIMAQEKFAYALTTFSIKLFTLNDNISDILSQFHTSLSDYIEKSLQNDHFSASRKQNLKHLRSKLSTIAISDDQKPLPNSIRSLPINMEGLNVSDLPGVLNNPTKRTFLDCDLILQIYHLPNNENISQLEYDSIIDKTTKVRMKFGEQNISSGYSCSSLSLINQDIVHAMWFNKLNSDNSIQLWNHINKFNLDNLTEHFIINKDRNFLFVLTKDGDFVISPFKQDDHYNRHIMLANGEPIITGGGIQFSKDLKKILSINNGTGHYKSSFETLKMLTPYLVNSNFNIQDTVFIDVVSGKEEKVLDKTNVLNNIHKLKHGSDLSIVTSTHNLKV